MDKETLLALLTKYHNGQATDEERAQVEAWYNALDAPVEPRLSEAEKRALLTRNWHRLEPQTTLETKIRRLPVVFYRNLAAAAVLILGINLGWKYVIRELVIPDQSVAISTTVQSVDKRNTSNKPLRVALSDGSTVTLRPGGQLRYPETFAGNRREVHLTGEAFFEVAKNPDKPFLVYANGMVTKVLGTSFTIIAHKGQPTAQVVVRTGRVAVFRQTEARQAEPTPDLVLIPNEKATFYKAESRLVKTLSDDPVLLRPQAARTQFAYNDTPMAEVFRELEEAYGVDIAFDAQSLANCTLTANLGTQPLPVKLNMICLSIGAVYRIDGTRIVVSGRGCP